MQIDTRLWKDIAPRLCQQHPDIKLSLDACIFGQVLAENRILLQKGGHHIEKLFAVLDEQKT